MHGLLHRDEQGEKKNIINNYINQSTTTQSFNQIKSQFTQS